MNTAPNNPNQLMQRRVVYISNSLENADDALWSALTSVTELSKGDKATNYYALALSRSIVSLRHAVHELQEAVGRELSEMVLEDYPSEVEE